MASKQPCARTRTTPWLPPGWVCHALFFASPILPKAKSPTGRDAPPPKRRARPHPMPIPPQAPKPRPPGIAPPEFDWPRVVEESHRALELNGSLEMPHYYLAVAFYHFGLFDLAEREVRAGFEINPTNRAEALRVRGSTALFSRHFQEAERHLTELRQVSSSQVSDWYLAQAMYYDGQSAPAEKILAALHGSAQAERRAQATLASFLAARHDREQATKMLQSVAAGTYMDHHVAYSMGVAYAQLGDFDEARRWLT